jgi:hypothetical protein
MKSKLSKLEKTLKPSHQKAWEEFYKDFYDKLPRGMYDLHESWCFSHVKEEWSAQMNVYGVPLLQVFGVDPELFEGYMNDNVHLLERLEQPHANAHIVPSELPDAPEELALLEDRLDQLQGLFSLHLAKAYCVLLIYEFYAWSVTVQEAKKSKQPGVLQ